MERTSPVLFASSLLCVGLIVSRPDGLRDICECSTLRHVWKMHVISDITRMSDVQSDVAICSRPIKWITRKERTVISVDAAAKEKDNVVDRVTVVGFIGAGRWHCQTALSKHLSVAQSTVGFAGFPFLALLSSRLACTGFIRCGEKGGKRQKERDLPVCMQPNGLDLSLIHI